VHTYLVDMLQCPACHGELAWDITDRSPDRIKTGSARCTACDTIYPIQEGIGVFLAPDQQREGMWEQESRQVRYVREHPEVERQLLESPLEALNPADQFFRAHVLEAQGKYTEARTAWERSQEGLYTAEARSAMGSQLDRVVELLPASDSPIVDLASGRCYGVEHILRAHQRPIVATDISLPVLRRDRGYLSFWGLYKWTSLLAFDARRTPFRDGAVETMTTFVGISSVQEPGDILSELRRVVSGTLLAISVFHPPEDKVHAPVIREAGLESTIYRAPALEAFAAAGWRVEVVNARTATVRPTPRGVLLEGFQVDGFPLAETTQESCVLVAR
jgi:uncharacterized protein YbaR (Trm112 family)